MKYLQRASNCLHTLAIKRQYLSKLSVGECVGYGPQPGSPSALKAVIKDIDGLAGIANTHLRQFNGVSRILKRYNDTRNISALPYTVDEERLKQTINKYKFLLLTRLE